MNKTKTNIKLGTVNFFGVVGYFACATQWLWAVILYFSLIEWFAKTITPEAKTKVVQPVTQISVGPPSLLQIIVVVAITVIMSVLTIYIIIKMPSVITKTSRKIIHNTADAFTPVVLQARDKQTTKKNRLRLAANIVIIVKILAVLIPILLALGSVFLDKQLMDYYLVMIVSFWLASFSIVFFTTQYLIAWGLKVDKQDIL